MLLLQNSGCAKEYSYEGGDTTAIITPIIPAKDSIPLLTDTTNDFPLCKMCDAAAPLTLGTWNFRKGKSYLCGSVSNSGFFSGNTKMNFTFFGPSSCSVDTGIVMSVFLPVPLDQDRSNIKAMRTAFYFYDNTAPKDIFITQPEKDFTLMLQSFDLATGIATGIFSGTVFKANGDTAFIAAGRYKVLIK